MMRCCCVDVCHIRYFSCTGTYDISLALWKYLTQCVSFLSLFHHLQLYMLMLSNVTQYIPRHVTPHIDIFTCPCFVLCCVVAIYSISRYYLVHLISCSPSNSACLHAHVHAGLVTPCTAVDMYSTRVHVCDEKGSYCATLSIYSLLLCFFFFFLCSVSISTSASALSVFVVVCGSSGCGCALAASLAACFAALRSRFEEGPERALTRKRNK